VHLLVIIGSTRTDRFSAKAAAWVVDRLDGRPGVTYEVLDLVEHPLPYFDAPPPAKAGRDYADPATVAVGRILDRADAFLVLTPEYNHGYPAVLKNLFDCTFLEWNRKPVAFVGWGNVGGARAVEQLRLVAVEMELAPLRHAVSILPDVMIATRDASADPVDAFAAHDPRLELVLTDLQWWSHALGAARAAQPDAVSR
jgi:NAD(P)H-dependent FMN reductase